MVQNWNIQNQMFYSMNRDRFIAVLVISHNSNYCSKILNSVYLYMKFLYVKVHASWFSTGILFECKQFYNLKRLWKRTCIFVNANGHYLQFTGETEVQGCYLDRPPCNFSSNESFGLKECESLSELFTLFTCVLNRCKDLSPISCLRLNFQFLIKCFPLFLLPVAASILFCHYALLHMNCLNKRKKKKKSHFYNLF